MVKYKNIIIILSLFLIITLVSTTVFADSKLTNGVTINKNRAKDAEKIGNTIFGIVKVVGTICSVITLMLIGIKYMMGSVEEKAEYKKTFGIYITGAILVFGISFFAEALYNMVNNLLS